MSLMRFSNQVPSVFDLFFEGDLFDWSNKNYSVTNTTLPTVNIKENNDAFVVDVAAPGFDKNDFKLELNNDLLTISSEKKDEHEAKEARNLLKVNLAINRSVVHSLCQILPMPTVLEQIMKMEFCVSPFPKEKKQSQDRQE